MRVTDMARARPARDDSAVRSRQVGIEMTDVQGQRPVATKSAESQSHSPNTTKPVGFEKAKRDSKDKQFRSWAQQMQRLLSRDPLLCSMLALACWMAVVIPTHAHLKHQVHAMKITIERALQFPHKEGMDTWPPGLHIPPPIHSNRIIANAVGKGLYKSKTEDDLRALRKEHRDLDRLTATLVGQLTDEQLHRLPTEHLQAALKHVREYVESLIIANYIWQGCRLNHTKICHTFQTALSHACRYEKGGFDATQQQMEKCDQTLATDNTELRSVVAGIIRVYDSDASISRLGAEEQALFSKFRLQCC